MTNGSAHCGRKYLSMLMVNPRRLAAGTALRGGTVCVIGPLVAWTLAPRRSST